MINQKEVDKTTFSIPENNLEIVKQKVKRFFELKLSVHIKYLDGHFKNGSITKILSDCFIINEFKDGTVFIFFSEIEKVDVYKEKEEAND